MSFSYIHLGRIFERSYSNSQWIIRSLYHTFKKFIANQLKQWKTDLTLRHNIGDIEIPQVQINRGIFQGDSLSPLLFCIAIDPLSKLKDQHIGYSLSKQRSRTEKEKDKISHLFFMDDLKVYAGTEEDLEKNNKTVHSYSRQIF